MGMDAGKHDGWKLSSKLTLEQYVLRRAVDEAMKPDIVRNPISRQPLLPANHQPLVLESYVFDFSVV